MKGAVFIALNELVESQHGLASWEALLSKVQPESGGSYVSTEDYPDEEIQRFVTEISLLLNVPSQDVTKTFGRFLFDELNSKFPMFTSQTPDLFPFLESIENVIHKEVRKLYNNPSLPSLECHSTDDDTLRIEYRSPRKLCYLAEGLIQGASDYYSTPISLEHRNCIHKGGDHCLFIVKKH